MANTKISALTDGTTAEATDKIPVERSGANRYVTPGYIKTYLGIAGTLSIASGKTFTASNTLTLAGTDSTTMTFPSTSATIARTDAANTFTGSQTLTGGTVTVSTPVIDATQTWNDGAVTFTGLKFNVTNTASAAASKLIDLQVGGSPVFSVTTSGSATSTLLFGAQYMNASVALQLTQNTGTINMGTSADVVLARDAADVFAQRRTTNAQTFRIYNTYTDSSNYERGFMRWASNILEIGAEAGGTGTARRLVLKSAAGQITVASSEFDDGYVSFYETTATAEARTTTARSFLINTSEFAYFHMRAGAYYGWTGSATNADVGVTPDTMLTRVAAGIVGVRAGSSSAGGAIGLVEQTAPSAPSANGVYIYAEDNGAGKTRLMALFPTGAAQQIAIEP